PAGSGRSRMAIHRGRLELQGPELPLHRGRAGEAKDRSGRHSRPLGPRSRVRTRTAGAAAGAPDARHGGARPAVRHDRPVRGSDLRGAARPASIVYAGGRGYLAQLPLADRRPNTTATQMKVTSEMPMPIQTDHGR